jgi:hypothetical protein
MRLRRFQKKILDSGLRRNDVLKAIGLKIVIPAQAGIQCLSSIDLVVSTELNNA